MMGRKYPSCIYRRLGASRLIQNTLYSTSPLSEFFSLDSCACAYGCVAGHSSYVTNKRGFYLGTAIDTKLVEQHVYVPSLFYSNYVGL